MAKRFALFSIHLESEWLPVAYFRPHYSSVLPICFAQIFVLGIVRSTVPSLVIDFFQQNYASASLATGIADGIGALLSFCLTPLIGELSDQVFGRRPVLIFTLILTSAPLLFLFLYPNYCRFNVFGFYLLVYGFTWQVPALRK